ncbi:MAG: T9SS type A sorting domain-containing protein [Chitinophagales bacterium]
MNSKNYIILFILFFININDIKPENITSRVYNIFQTNCTNSGCHNNIDIAGNLDLQGNGENADLEVYNNLYKKVPYNVISQLKNDYLVYPSKPYQSIVFTYIASQNNANIRLNPLEDPYFIHRNLEISDLDQEMIRQWILNGAKPHDTEVDVELVEDFYDGQGIWNIDQQNPPLPPDIQDGFQIRIGPIFMKPSDIAAGNLSDNVYTIKHDLLNDSPLEMKQISAIIGTNHHFSCYKYLNNDVGNQQDYGLHTDGASQNTKLLFIFPQTDDYILPQGTAMRWEENSSFDFQIHIANYSEDFILAQDVYINVYTQQLGTAAQEMKFKNWGKTVLNIPPNTTSFEEEIEMFIENPTIEHIYIWLLGSHTHLHGLDFDIWLRNIDGSKGEHVYDASHYNGIPTCEFIGYNYETPPNRIFNFPFLKLNMQEGLISRATYFNETDETIVFGTTASIEEMFGTGIFYVTDTAGVSFNEGSICYADEINSINVVEKAEKLSLNIFPNPIKQIAQLNIASYFAGNIIGTLYDFNGRVVRQVKHFVPSNNQIRSFIFEKENLQNGIYFYEIQDQKGNRKVKRLVISE